MATSDWTMPGVYALGVRYLKAALFLGTAVITVAVGAAVFFAAGVFAFVKLLQSAHR